MGAPYGNRNAARGTEWRQAITRVLRRYKSKSVSRGRALEAIAERLVGKALRGDIEAIREIGLRLDGKPFQQIEIESPADQQVPVTIVMPYNNRGPAPGETEEAFRERVERERSAPKKP
jgi:hypothetical protein